jgi:uncharacterized protein (TIGR03086 family)
MNKLRAFDTVLDEFRERLASVREEDWVRPSPCSEWSVRDLVVHVVGHNAEIAEMVTGDPHDHSRLGDDLLAEWDRTVVWVHDAFHRPGAMEAMVHHPSGDMPGSHYIEMRIGGYLVHTWDLARGIGGSEKFDPDVLAIAYAHFAPRLGATANARLAAAPTEIPEDTPILEKILLLAGRHP